MKIKFFVLFILLVQNANLHAQAPITDTLQYLQDSILANKSQYIGKPLDSLLKDLKMSVIHAWDGMGPLPETPDTLYCDE